MNDSLSKQNKHLAKRCLPTTIVLGDTCMILEIYYFHRRLIYPLHYDRLAAHHLKTLTHQSFW